MTRDHLPPDASPELRAIAAAALAGGALARRMLQSGRGAALASKGRADYQTEADRAVEAEIAAALRAAFPGCGIAGEEQVADAAPAPGQPVFVIDPIDGTTNFAWGIPHFAVVIAELRDGALCRGVTLDAMLGELFAAEAGQGAWLDGQRLALVAGGALPDVVIGAGLPIRGQVRSVSEARYHAALARAMDETAGVRRLGSSALSIAYVAAGRLDGFFEDMLSLHDYGASALILREAGGTVTGLDGGPLQDPGGVLAAAPGLHGWLLDGLAG
ncbi:inositol monophosphatase family protein [Poseidonocella sp. HB161398]|uniref:inositol monophosphatase family protein n=1 Tax=Poseidonocella sp. HB161398 TaxID=2320855 RepID=UPI0011082848|nr:inositol monophosphatase family protein [Poseidonocella sp. HB161398]